MAGKEKSISWKRLLYDFSQATTFHGVRYITADTPFILRRIIWFMLVLTASSVFIWFMTLRLQYLNSNPKAVDVEVIYTDSVNFPAVTICNQNLFRASATLELGLHDMVEDSFRDLQNKGLDLGDDEDTSTRGFEVYHDTYMEGMGRPHVTYMGITAQVCRHLCVKMHSDSCCSVLYARGKKKCYITPLEKNSNRVRLVPRENTDYYRRKKCQVQREAGCSFEKDTCMFVGDTSKTVSWKIVSKHDKKVDVKRPDFDHTTLTGHGKYLLSFTKFPQPNSVAHLISPYILSDDNTCLDFYYQLRGGSLNVKVRITENEEVVVWSRKGGSAVEWEKAHQQLPAHGYFRVVLESLSETGTERLNAVIDDVQIGPCATSHPCRETTVGRGYAGSLSKSRSGRACANWESVPAYLLDYLWASSDPEVINKRELKNFCRNPDDDAMGPWCYTDIDSGRMENCNIPVCACRDVEFACDNGRCVSTDMLCNKVDECGDNSDEIIPCNRTRTIDCDFDEGWMCGYRTHESSRVPWVIKYTDHGHHAGVDTTKSRNGDIAVLVSPPVELQELGCLHLDYYIAGEVQLDIFRTNRTHRYSKERLCSLVSPAGWNSTDIMLPPGEYRLQFEAALDRTSEVGMYLDNITLYSENCTAIELEEFGEYFTPEVTTSVETTTDENSTMTTDSYFTTERDANMTTMTYYEYVHEAFAHLSCTANNTDCKTCARKFSTIEGCEPSVELMLNETRGLSVSCEQLKERGDHTLDTCKIETLALGGNAFNLRDSHCQVVRCPSNRVEDFRLTESQGGWNVYNFIVPGEGIDVTSFDCMFSDRCACGYEYLSSNRFDRWERQERVVEDKGNENDTSINKETDYFITVINEYGKKPRNGDWSRLISPIRDVRETSCLRFDYYTRYVNIDIYRETDDEWSPVIYILHDGQFPGWHTAAVTIPVGVYRLIFNMVFGMQYTKEMAGLDNINITSGSCIEQMENVVGPFNCTFDTDDQCGYHDASPGPVKFIQSQSFEMKTPGGYYMRSSALLNGKGSTALQSPFYTYSNISCLQFYYFVQSTRKDLLSTFALSAEYPDGSRTMIWHVRTVTDNRWHFAQTEVYYGYFRLVFEINGDQIRGGVDNIVVIDAECPAQNCTVEDEEYMCVSNFACIPHSNVCDGLPNCALGEDERDPLCGNGTLLIELDEEEKLEEKIDVDAEDTGVAVDLTKIYKEGGHQGEDLIYRCAWEGQPCYHHNFTKEVTDYGLCYTFNAEEEPLRTALTGSRFGLTLTLNIEQYEYMRGPQSDAGIKVFLHSKEELPQVRDLGFAISPGTHALVGIRLNEAENLPDPWGDCSTKELIYYDSYVHSRCLRECETKQIVGVCGCRDSYMPGHSEDDPPVCNLTRFFTCAIPTINSVESADTDCPCPKPCKQTVYEPSLSHAALSVLSVDKILSADINELSSKYHAALDAKQRVQEATFLDDLQMINEIHRQYVYMRQFAKKYLGDFERSKFAKIWEASNTLVTIFDGDIKALMQEIPAYEAAYSAHYEDTANLLTIYVKDLNTGFHEVSQLLKIRAEGGKSNRFLLEIMEKMHMKVTLASQNFRLFQQKLADRDRLLEEAADDERNHLLPERYTAKNNQCTKDMSTLLVYLGDLKRDLEDVNLEDLGKNTTNATVYDEIQEHMDWFMKKSAHIQRCLQEYRVTLTKTKELLNSALKSADNFRSQRAFAGQSFNFTAESMALEADEKEVGKIYQKYSFAQIKKMQYLRHFDPEEQSSDVTANINSFVNRIQTRLTDPLRERIQKIRRDLEKEYKNCFETATDLQMYLPAQSFYKVASAIKIWRIPTPNLENPERFEDSGTEYWKVWNRDMDMEKFTQKEFPKHVTAGLDSFCDQLLEILDGFDQQLLLNKQKLLAALERVQGAHVEYLKMRRIEHEFVLKNFLNMDVYFAQLKHQNVKQIEAYQLTQFLGDVGGFMGLLLGGSVLTVFELVDLIIFNFVKRLLNPLTVKPQGPEEETTESDASQKSKNGSQAYANKMAPLSTSDMYETLTKRV